MDINTIGSFTEICISGGGNFLSESRPTNFHHFYTRKALAKGERPEDYMEVTAKERENIEQSDAAWQRPPQWVIDEFNADPHGRYNEDTGYGELNGLTNLSAQEMMDIAKYGNKITGNSDFCVTGGSVSPLIRTNLTPINGSNGAYVASLGYLFYGQSKLEVASLSNWNNHDGTDINMGSLTSANGDSWLIFGDCKKLKKILGRLLLVYSDAITTSRNSIFRGCGNLEEVRICRLRTSLNMQDCGKLSFESLDFLVSNADRDCNIIVTLHPDAYARLTDELIAQASEKQIQFVTV